MADAADDRAVAVCAGTPAAGPEGGSNFTPVQKAAPASSMVAPANEEEGTEFSIVFGKSSDAVRRDLDVTTVGQLKAEVEERLGIPAGGQKLLCSGKALKDDSVTLKAAGVKKGSKVMLLGSLPSAVKAVSGAASASDAGAFDGDEAARDDPICKQAQHAKVRMPTAGSGAGRLCLGYRVGGMYFGVWLEGTPCLLPVPHMLTLQILSKGVPEDALPSITGKQIPLAAGVTCVPGMLNSQGVKVRLTFKEDLQQLWVGSATTTQKVPYATIRKIEAFPIEGNEAYSIMALHLGSGKYWLYFVPSQHVASIKIKILGVESLL